MSGAIELAFLLRPIYSTSHNKGAYWEQKLIVILNMQLPRLLVACLIIFQLQHISLLAVTFIPSNFDVKLSNF